MNITMKNKARLFSPPGSGVGVVGNPPRTGATAEKARKDAHETQWFSFQVSAFRSQFSGLSFQVSAFTFPYLPDPIRVIRGQLPNLRVSLVDRLAEKCRRLS